MTVRGAASRRLAVEARLRIEQDGAYANLVVPRLLDDHPELAAADHHFVTELVYGTTRMRRAVDWLVDRFLLAPPAPEVREALRVGAYQLAFLGVPAHAAVGATVEAAPRRARGLVNAVLRRVAGLGPASAVAWPDLATRLSYPDHVVDRLVRELGEADAVAALERMNVPPPVSERADGYVQDRASQWVADLVGALPGERVLDLCAAPGGKATRLAHDVGPDGRVIAVELRPARAGLVVANAGRTGVAGRLDVVVADGRAAPLAPASFDRVLVDAPCSGLGALRRRPDARWRVEDGDVARLAAVHRDLLRAARPLVRPGGVLVSSVCTLTAAESIDLDDGAWEALDAPPPPWRPYGRGGRLLPQDADTDGMVVLRWRAPGVR